MRTQRTLDITVVIRAVAIVLVVVEHAQFRVTPGFMGWSDAIGVENLRLLFPGGMTVLFMLAGGSFFRFLVTEDRATTSRNILRFSIFLAAPAIALILLSFMLRNSINLSELLLVSIWFGPEKVSHFPVWYIQVFVQLNLALLLVLQFDPLRSLAVQRPVIASSGLLAIGLAVFLGFSAVLGEDTEIRLTHMLLWNFALGWWISSLIDLPGRSNVGTARRLLVFGVAVAVVALVYVHLQPVRITQVTALLALYVFVDSVRMPVGMANVVLSVAQSVFGIFLLHLFGISVGREIFALVAGENVYLAPFVKVAFGVATGVIGWAVVRSVWQMTRSRLSRFRKAQEAPAQATLPT